MLCFSLASRGGRKGGDTFGRFVKLFGNLAEEVEAIADALSMANGFFPVSELPPPDPLDDELFTKLLVPLVFVVLDIPF